MTTLKTIYSLFPYQIKKDLNKFDGRSKDILLLIINHIGGVRNLRQKMLKTCDTHEDAAPLALPVVLKKVVMRGICSVVRLMMSLSSPV